MLLVGKVGNQGDVFPMHLFGEPWCVFGAELGWAGGHGGLGLPGAGGAAQLP